MILVDSNVPMYLLGAPHPLKADAQRLLERCIAARERLVTDAEVLQEVLHRYVAIDRLDAIQPAFDAVLGLVDDGFPVDLPAVARAHHRPREPAPVGPGRHPCGCHGTRGHPPHPELRFRLRRLPGDRTPQLSGGRAPGPAAALAARSSVGVGNSPSGRGALVRPVTRLTH